tara:strand:- start:261 stop:566 length:306 start_codon:yes stop_codon:yes gene_type:complete
MNNEFDHLDVNPEQVPEHIKRHLFEEMEREITELNELQEIIETLSQKASRRVRKIQNHSKYCGICLSEQIKAGILVTVEDYWKMAENAGGGRYPKLHHMVN